MFRPMVYVFSVCLSLSLSSTPGQQRLGTPNGYNNGGREGNTPPQNDPDYKYGRFDASALHIAHALKQTEIQKAYDKPREKPIDYYLVSDIYDGYLRLVFVSFLLAYLTTSS